MPTPSPRIHRSGYIRPGAGYAVGENIAAADSYLRHSGGHRQDGGWTPPGIAATSSTAAYRDTGIGVAPRPSHGGAGPGGDLTEDFWRHELSCRSPDVALDSHCT